MFAGFLPRAPQVMRTASQDDVYDVPHVHPEAVARVCTALPDAACVEATISLLKMVADSTQLRILSALI